MRHTHVAASLLLAIPLLSHAAEITLTFNGKITSSQTTFDGLPSGYLSNIPDQALATARAAMAPLKVDQNVSLSYTLDTDQLPWNPENAYGFENNQYVDYVDQIIGGRFGSADGQHGHITTTISVADAGLNYSNTAPSNEGSRFVRIRSLGGTTSSEGSYLDFHVADDQARFSGTMVSSRVYDSFVSFTQSSGKDWENRNLSDLLSNFNYADSVNAGGRFYVFDPSCTYTNGQCGYAEFSVLSTTLQTAVVPEPSSWALMGLGLAGIMGVATQRRRQQG